MIAYAAALSGAMTVFGASRYLRECLLVLPDWQDIMLTLIFTDSLPAAAHRPMAWLERDYTQGEYWNDGSGADGF